MKCNKSTILIRKRTEDNLVSNDFRILCHRNWHYGGGKYPLLKNGNDVK